MERRELDGKHPCRDKIISIAGLVAGLELPAMMHLLVDVWEQSYANFHK